MAPVTSIRIAFTVRSYPRTAEGNRNGQPVAVRYLRRRFIPPAQGAVTLVQHTVRQGDRVDNVTALYINDPTRFWTLCDTNVVLRPTELTDTLGHVIKIALPLSPDIFNWSTMSLAFFSSSTCSLMNHCISTSVA